MIYTLLVGASYHKISGANAATVTVTNNLDTELFSGSVNFGDRNGSGNFFVADTGNDVIRKITPQGIVSTLAGTVGVSGFLDGQGLAAKFHGVDDVACDGIGNLFGCDVYNKTIRKVDPTGYVTTGAP